MDQINQSIDIIVQHGVNDSSDAVQMIKLTQSKLAPTRPLYSIQHRDILAIRQYFNEKNWLLLPTYATMNTMYLCPKIEFEQQVSEHFIQTEGYELIKDCATISQDDIKCFFDSTDQYICQQLNYLRHYRRVTMKQYSEMMSFSKRDEIQITSVKFLPDIRTQIVSFQPRIVNASGTITSIARYLHQVLQTTYILATHSTTLNNGTDAIQAIETFTKKGFLKANTQFVTLEVKDFDITFTHAQVIETLKYFLQEFAPHRSTTSNLSHKTIIRLVRLVLKMQYFMYDNKLYQQTKGSNPDSPLTKLLVNIYLLYWQQDLMQLLKRRKEFFGRCYNTMFFTWNGPKRAFYSMFARIKEKLPGLPIQLSIGKSVHYLDVQIAHDHGILRTKMSRAGLTERYTVPYLANYPMDQYASMIRKHLIYAIRSCTNIQDFQEEHLLLHSSYLFNRFPLDFIVHSIHQFFNEFNSSKLDYKYEQKTYGYLRQCVMTNDQVFCLPLDKKRSSPDDLDIETSIKRIKI